jgi:hypothetical protein
LVSLFRAATSNDAAAGSGTRLGELWRYTSPYRGLAAMGEKDSDYFFGREQETVDVLSALAAAADRLPVLLGNSGVGKSSLAQAGALAALKRQAWPEGVPPLREAELCEVVSRPAELLSARFETAGLADIITRRTAEDSVKDERLHGESLHYRATVAGALMRGGGCGSQAAGGLAAETHRGGRVRYDLAT